MTEPSKRDRFRVSIKTLMIVVAVCALLLTPIVFTFRGMIDARDAERRFALLNRRLAEEARAQAAALAQAERTMYLAEVQSAEALFAGTKAGAAVQTTMGSQSANHQEQLWAALSVSHAIFKQGQTKDLSLEFTLINDGAAVIDPKIAESRIVINGKEVADAGLILGSGPKDPRFNALPPGDNLQFGFVLGDHFTEPGIYRVSWKGPGFRSPEIMLRILAEKAK